MKSFKLDRRAILRGAGIAVALPVLDAMLDSKGLFHGTAEAQTRMMQKRLFTWFFPGGVDPGDWYPDAYGTGYVMKPSLQPLAANRAHVTLLGGVNLNVNMGDGDAHGKGTACFAAGAPLTPTASTGHSIDQAARVDLGMPGESTLNLALEGKPCCFTAGGITNVADVYGEISWQPGGAVVAQRDPVMVFDSLFGALPPTDPAAERERRYESTILGYVRADITRLQARLGASDRQRLEAYLTTIRELEQQIMMMASEPVCARPDRPSSTSTGVSNNRYSTARAKIMMDLMAVGAACGLRRFGSFMLGNGSNNSGCANRAILADEISAGRVPGRDRATAVELDEHSAAHDGDTPVRRYDQIRLYKSYHMTLLNYFADKLKSFTEGSGTVLDNTVIFAGSELSDPVAHSHNNMPIVLVGHGGGAIPGGRAVQCNNAPVGNVLLTLLRAVGSTRASIGNSTGTIPAILGM